MRRVEVGGCTQRLTIIQHIASHASKFSCGCSHLSQELLNPLSSRYTKREIYTFIPGSKSLNAYTFSHLLCTGIQEKGSSFTCMQEEHTQNRLNLPPTSYFRLKKQVSIMYNPCIALNPPYQQVVIESDLFNHEVDPGGPAGASYWSVIVS